MKKLYCLVMGHRINEKYYKPILTHVHTYWYVKCEDCGKFGKLGKWIVRLRK